MNEIIETLYLKRLEVLGYTENKHEVDDVLFLFQVNDSQVSNFRVYLLPIVGQDKISQKNELSERIAYSIILQAFPEHSDLKFEKNDLALYFSFDLINSVDVSYFVNYEKDFYSKVAFTLGQLKLFDANYSISGRDFLTGNKLNLLKGFIPNLPSKLESSYKTNTTSRLVVNDRMKGDSEMFKQEIDKRNIGSLYHFTDRSNIDSIITNNGLYSWKSCQLKGINVSMMGSNSLSRSLDTYYGLEDYVRLSFTQTHPMLFVALEDGRIVDPVVLLIDPVVMLWQETRFSNMNATRNGHIQGRSLNHFLQIKFEIFEVKDYFDLNEDLKPYYQAEVLVKSFIPAKYIQFGG